MLIFIFYLTILGIIKQKNYLITRLIINFKQYKKFLNIITQKLEELNQVSDFNNYLIFVLTKLTSEGIVLSIL